MSNIARVFLLLSVFLACRFLEAQGQLPRVDTPIFPESGSIRCIQIPAYTFQYSELTNCYILAGKTGEAIIIDPADQLEIIADKATGNPSKKILADAETGESVVIETQKLANYIVVKTNAYNEPTTVRDPATGRIKYVYDQFRTTNTYAPRILKLLADNKLKLKYIIISHGHLDHFGAVTYLQEKTGAKVLMHGNDVRTRTGGIVPQPENAAVDVYPKDTYRILGLSTKIDRVLKDGDTISMDGMELQVIHTPGHSPGGICLLTRQGDQPILFSADTLLRWGYLRDAFGRIMYDAQGNPLTADTGRTNFVDGSGDEVLLYRMLREKLFVLPDATIVYPGHYEATSIGEEKKYSPARFIPADQKPTGPETKTPPALPGTL